MDDQHLIPLGILGYNLRSSEENISWQQRCALAQEGNRLRNVEDHVYCVRILRGCC